MPTLANFDDMAHVVFAGFIDGTLVFGDAEGTLRLVNDRVTDHTIHDGLLAVQPTRDGKHLMSGGEDGKVVATASDGATRLVCQKPGKWIDRIACGPGGVVAFASGRTAFVVMPDGSEREIECERSIEGLAFAPKGMRLAMARYNGVDLVWVNTQNAPQFLEWKGAHTGVCFSPDGKYLVTTMQENALHGWRLSDAKNMRMSGYPAKVKSLSWSAKGKWLATSGAPAAICWPFVGKDGPMGKAPKELGSMGQVQVTCVACHPTEDMVAIGYEDGMILAVRISDGKEVPLRRAGEGEITSMGWNSLGSGNSSTRLAFGSSQGNTGVINLTD